MHSINGNRDPPRDQHEAIEKLFANRLKLSREALLLGVRPSGYTADFTPLP